MDTTTPSDSSAAAVLDRPVDVDALEAAFSAPARVPSRPGATPVSDLGYDAAVAWTVYERITLALLLSLVVGAAVMIIQSVV